MNNKFILISASVALTAMLTGCASNQGQLGNRDIRPNSVRYDANGNMLNGNNTLRNNSLNNMGNMNNTNNMNKLNTNGVTDKRFANDQMNDMNRVDGRRLNSNNIVGNHANYKIEMSDKIANKLVGMNAVKSAYVMLGNNNAYVAVSFADHYNHANPKALSRTNSSYMNKGNTDMHRKMSTLSTGEDSLTDEVKASIAKEVKRMYPKVDNVYVSANPDFVSRMNGYMNDVRLGHPIQGFVAEFNGMVERIFPANAMHQKSLNEKKAHKMIYDYNR